MKRYLSLILAIAATVSAQIVPSTGNVRGPTSATDNAVARYDGTTGKLIQNSGVTIDDSGNLTVAGVGTFNKSLDNITTESDYAIRIKTSADDGGLYLGANSTISAIQAIDPNTTFSRNLAIQSQGGNVLIGTTSDLGQKLQVSGTMYVSGASSILGDLSTFANLRSIGATNTIRVRGNSQYIDFTNSAESGYVSGTIIANTLNLFGNNGTGLSIGTTGDATFAGTVTVNAANPKVRWQDTSNTQDQWQASVSNDATQAWSLINNTSGYGTVMLFSRLGALRLNNYGAGTLSTDASGNVTASSDARLKTNLRTFARGLADVIKLAPKTYNWNETSGMDTDNDYVGFVAQDVQYAIPEGVYEGKDANKTLTLNDRAILAALVNAVKELNAKVAALEAARN